MLHSKSSCLQWLQQPFCDGGARTVIKLAAVAVTAVAVTAVLLVLVAAAAEVVHALTLF
jgi:hypothetical protein